ncbi:hypothetical protein [Eubacterium xylanophilum]|uniref:hypothetical protein n=1 Tax=Eubacterium xylanophilum TaxID=39497 RepID=UPI000478F986|nr:hypothetical protein [Eubacterium xylanophilum]
MKTNKITAFILAFAMSLSLAATPASTNAAETAKKAIKVTLNIMEYDGALVANESVELSDADVAELNKKFTVTTPSADTGSTETTTTPVVTAEGTVAAHALMKYENDYVAKNPKTSFDFGNAFSYGNPSVVVGQKTLKAFDYWSFKINNVAPNNPTTGYGYNLNEAPLKDGDVVTIFRQGTYDADKSTYTNFGAFTENNFKIEEGADVKAKMYEEGYDASFNIVKSDYKTNDVTFVIQKGDKKANVSATLNNDEFTLSGKDIAAFTNGVAGDYSLYAVANKEIVNADGVAKVVFAPSVLTVNVKKPAETAAPKTSDKKSAVKKPAKPAKVKVKVKGKKVTVSWKKAKAKGYQVVYSKKAKKAYKTFKNVKKNKAVKKLKKGKFFIKVRAYNVKANGKKLYSAYSAAKKVVVK